MTEKDFARRLARRARRAGVALPAELTGRLWVYFDLLFRWNRKINLTSLSLDSPDQAIDRLLVEPLLAARHVLPTDRRMIDIGSGGGSPAIPLRLAAPLNALILVESKARKSAFLREVMRQLGIEGSVETMRFEELLPRPEFHEGFDLLTLRAVRVDAKTLGSLQAFVRQSGRLFLFGSPVHPGSQSGWLAPPLKRDTHVALTDGSELAILEKMRIP
jgi:16S rRNA (guanine527-N7)-methyltransferase